MLRLSHTGARHTCGCGAWHLQRRLERCGYGLHPASKFTALGRARALVHVACKMLCNKLHKLVSDEWSKRKSMWDGTGRFAIGKKRARSVRHLCVERARAGRTTGAW
jgi:hypothetical protein